MTPLIYCVNTFQLPQARLASGQLTIAQSYATAQSTDNIYQMK